MSARHGKIARLPQSIREELNTRILNGEPATTLVPWLNSQSIVQCVLEEHFEGKPISEQNISNWREGGFVDWYVQEDWRAICRTCAGDADRLAVTGFNAGKFLLMLTARLAVSLDCAEGDPSGVLKDNPAFHKLIASVLRIHQSELKDARLALDRERHEFQQEKVRARIGDPSAGSFFGRFSSSADQPVPARTAPAPLSGQPHETSFLSESPNPVDPAPPVPAPTPARKTASATPRPSVAPAPVAKRPAVPSAQPYEPVSPSEEPHPFETEFFRQFTGKGAPAEDFAIAV